MTILNSELYDALTAAKVPEDKARAAAQSVAAYELKQRFAKLEANTDLLCWMVGMNILFSVAILARLFMH